jgi:hypothetical protein
MYNDSELTNIEFHEHVEVVDLSTCSIDLQPENLPTKRIWSKKYPIRIRANTRKPYSTQEATKKMAAKKRTTKKASNSIVEPKPTTSSNGRRIAILVIVVLGIVILWRNDPPADDAVTDVTPETWSPKEGEARDLDNFDTFVPATQADEDNSYLDKRNGEEYVPQTY